MTLLYLPLMGRALPHMVEARVISYDRMTRVASIERAIIVGLVQNVLQCYFSFNVLYAEN